MTVTKCTETIHVGTFSFFGCQTTSMRCDNCGKAVTREEIHRAYHNAFDEALEILADAGVLETSDQDKLR